MARRPVTDAERDRVRELHGQGWSRARIARELSRPAVTVGRIADRLGLTWDRSRTEQATRAAAADLAARRAELAALLLGDAFRMRERVWSTYEIKTPVALMDGGTSIVTIQYDLPPAAETRNLVTSLAVLIDKHVSLVKVDTDQAGGAAVDAWLTAMGVD